MHKDIEIVDTSSDIGLRIYGKTLEDVFCRGAIGLYSLITDLSKIDSKKNIKINIYSESLDSLYVNWLNELIFQFDTYGFIGCNVDLDVLTKNKVEAIVKGENFDPTRHEKGLLLKAATYHKFKIEKKAGVWEVEVIFDI